jgi:hypothetical protein
VRALAPVRSRAPVRLTAAAGAGNSGILATNVALQDRVLQTIRQVVAKGTDKADAL